MNYITTIQFNHVLYDIGENIFDLLSNKDLKNCREVCKDWRAAIDGEKYLWHRMTKVHNGKFSLWTEVLMNCNKKTTKELALATREYYFKFIRDENENELALVTPRSQLHFAIWLGNKDVFQTIWDKIGAKDKTEPDETDMVPLQYAAEYGDCEIFKTIYENSVDKDPRGRYGYSLLHHAADNGRFEIIDEILKKDYIEDKNPEDRFGRTALHIAAREGHLTVCKILLEVAKNKSPKDNNGRVPLHMAAREGHLPVCQLLLDAAEDKNPKDDKDVTPYSLALENGHQEVARFISEMAVSKLSRGLFWIHL